MTAQCSCCRRSKSIDVIQHLPYNGKNMRWIHLSVCCCLTLLTSTFAQRQMEYLNRGVVALPTAQGSMFGGC